MTEDRQQGPSVRRAVLFGAAILIGGAVGIAGIYGMGGFERNAGAGAICRPALDMAKRIAPLARGEVAAVTPATKPLQITDLSFRDATGQERRLADWKDRVVLLNLWATWCVPCRKEMPALERLEAKMGSDKFQVVAVNIDTRDHEKPKAWLKEVGINKLAYFADPSAKAFQDLKAAGRAFGMPTTMLIGPDGCEIGTIAGPAEWASEDALKLVRAAIGG